MKRMLILVLSFLMLITGCAKGEEQPSIPSENSTVAESTQIDTPIEEENEDLGLDDEVFVYDENENNYED